MTRVTQVFRDCRDDFLFFGGDFRFPLQVLLVGDAFNRLNLRCVLWLGQVQSSNSANLFSSDRVNNHHRVSINFHTFRKQKTIRFAYRLKLNTNIFCF